MEWWSFPQFDSIVFVCELSDESAISVSTFNVKNQIKLLNALERRLRREHNELFDHSPSFVLNNETPKLVSRHLLQKHTKFDVGQM